jgi:hypothetical protein
LEGWFYGLHEYSDRQQTRESHLFGESDASSLKNFQSRGRFQDLEIGDDWDCGVPRKGVLGTKTRNHSDWTGKILKDEFDSQFSTPET